MKSFRNRLAVVLSALILIFGTGCPQPVEPETDYSADVAAAKSALAIEFASGDSASSITQDITLPAKVGDVFVKWSSSNTAVISNDGDVVRPAFADGNASVTLTATLTKGTASDTKAFNVTVLAVAPYSYTVTFDSQNADTAANPSSIVVTEPATTVVSLPTTPVKSGFEFGGWFTETNGGGTAFTASTVVSGNITVYAKWTAVAPVDTSAQDVASLKSTLAISFVDGDTATSVTKNITLPSGSNGVNVSWNSSNANVVSTAGVVTRPAFADGNASVTLTATLTKGTASDTKAFNVTVLALAPYSYTVTFDSQSADATASPSSIVVTEPATKVSLLPSTPEKSGFTFGGWFTETEGNGTEFTTDTTVTENITLYAKWDIAVYSITYVLNGNEDEIGNMESNPTNYTKENELIYLQQPTRTGYEFVGWYTTETFDDNCIISTISPDNYFNDLTLYAKWIKLCTVNYITDYVTTPDTVVLQEGTSLASYLYELSVTGWEFEGWYLDSACTERVASDYIVSNSITLHAKWSECFDWQVTNEGAYSFTKRGNSWISNNEYVSDSTATTTWELNVRSQIRYTISYSVSSEQNYDKMSIVLDGNTIVNGISGSVSSSYTAILSEGVHSLTATYSKDSGADVGNDQAILVLEAVNYETQSYNPLNIEYSTTHDVQPQAVIVEKGTVLSSSYLPELSETGWEFKGWYNGSEGITEGFVIQDNLILTAKWEIISYRITYDIQGGKENVQNPSSYTVEDEIELKDPAYAGKTFGGWFLDSDFTQKITRISQGSMTGDITLYARWGEAGGVTVSLKEYNDITVSYTRSGNFITFTGPDDYTSYEWQLDGSKIQTSNSYLSVNVSNWKRGKHTIMLFASTSSGTKRTATVYVNIE